MFNSLVPTPAVTGEQQLTPAQLYSLQLGKDQIAIMKLLPISAIELTPDEQTAVQTYQMANLVLGAAAGAPMICSKGCPAPIKAACPLAQINKAPIGKHCPFEQQYVSERFISWMKEMSRDLDTLLESERSAISTLVLLDLQERRCSIILSDAENAQLTSRSVRDVDVESGQPLAWEDVIHANAERLNQIVDKRRMILRDLELTPEMKTKRAKAMGNIKGGGQGKDFSSRSADTADKLRRALTGEPQVIDIT